MFSMFLYLTLYIQDVLGYDPLQAGLRFLPITLMTFVVAPISGRLSVRVPVRLLLGVGLLCVSGGLLAMTAVNAELGLDDADPRLPARRLRRRHDQPAARLHRDRRRALLAQRHGLGHQQHLPPGRHRHRDRRPRRRLPARGRTQDDRRAVPRARPAARCSAPRTASSAARSSPAKSHRSQPAPPCRARGPRPRLPGRVHRRLHDDPDHRRRDRLHRCCAAGSRSCGARTSSPTGEGESEGAAQGRPAEAAAV